MKNNTINKQNRFWNMHMTAILSLSLVLFLVGLVSLLAFLANDMSNYIRQNMTVSIVLTDSADVEYEQRIENMLLNGGYAKETKFISKDDALSEHIASMGDNPADFLGYNPLLASIEVKLNPKYASTDSIAKIESKLQLFNKISRITYPKDTMDLVNRNITRIGIILGTVALALLLISIALISSTIRLMIYADRFLIRSMWLVGATSWFIRKPYIWRGMFDGFVAALLACGYLALFVWFLQHSFQLNLFAEKPLILSIVAGIVIIAGVMLTAILSFFAVGRYINMKTEKMFRI
ncbi:MAG: permease-like cell division protein FtsX [Prevotellaceae bacterium]|jgi:cell division transport system permease protein|nr:permease-like cell division protein FtsX [Prevotellaceae bacterium]